MSVVPRAYLLLLGAVMAAFGWSPAQLSNCDVNRDGATNVADVQLVINEALGITSPSNDLNGDGVVNVVDVQIVINAALGLGCSAGSGVTVSDFNPKSGPAGTMVTLTGTAFGSSPQVTMPNLNGGSITLPLQSVANSSVSVLIPSGAVTGTITVATSAGSAVSASSFSVTAPNTFSLTASPSAATLVQGQNAAYIVQLASTNGFNQLAQLSVTGLPSGVTASFKPASLTTGQASVLTLTAPANQAVTTANISISATATVTGIPLTQSAAASLAIVTPSTSLIGRTVVSNPLETPLAGVTISTLGLDGNGNTTGCTGHTTVADSGGNFLLTNLPQSCTGPQLMEFDGTTATSPAGKYAGVNLVFTLVQGQVTPSPVLVHLPRIDNVETFMVQQNASANQSYAFTSIPGLSLTVYAGTTFTMADGTKPNPFPLAAVQVPVDRLPDLKPNVPTMIRVFIVAFQPANTVASQPVAVFFPNVSNTAPGTDMPLMTLDPTHGTMVPYGTGAVSANGTQVVPDADPAHPGHLYGLVHFDWHGQMPGPPSNNPPSGPGPCDEDGCDGPPQAPPPPPTPPEPDPQQSQPQQTPQPQACHAQEADEDCDQGAAPKAGDPVDLGSGVDVITATDISIRGGRGSISIQRIYCTLATSDGPFGIGSQSQYGWELDASSPNSAAAINLISPAGNRFLFSRQTDGTLTNSSTTWLRGAVMTTNGNQQTNLRFFDRKSYQFQQVAGLSVLTSITDRNGNVTTLTQTIMAVSSGVAIRITSITDPVGRSLNLTYDSNGHITSVADPIGRTVTYTYNSVGILATVTDPAGGVTKYQYDSQNRITSLTDARGVVAFQNTYDANGRVSQQVLPDGGVVGFSYVLANPLVPTSPVISTTFTDALGNQTAYRFDIQGYLTDVTDALGQTKSFVRDPGTNQVLQITGPAQCAVCGRIGEGDRSFTYDSRGNKLTYTDARGNTTHYTYDSVFNQITSVTDPLNHTSTYSYDASGNLISATDQNGNTTKNTYDPNGLPIQTIDPLGNTTSIAYDGFGNPVSVTDSLGNVTKILFDSISRPALITDPLSETTTLSVDALSRIVSVRDGRGSSTQFSYDPVGNLLTLTDPRGNATTFAYDTFNRVKTRTSALGKTESYQYDLNGNLVQFTDRRGQINSFQYDLLNRLMTEKYQDGAVVARAYDPYGRLLTVNDSVGGLFGFGYDLNGSLVSQGEPTGSINYTRDALHRIATRQVVGQGAVTYTYDPVGNMLGASMPNAGITYSYDTRNLPGSVQRTNGVSSSYTFDALGRVLSLIHSKGSTALNTQTYSYDSTGNRSSASNDISQPLITQPVNASVDLANELLTNGQTTYTSDANGNRLTETSFSGTTTYQWDSRNRLSSIRDASGNVTSFKYDFARNLIEMDKTVAGSVTAQRFVVDGLTNVASLTDSFGLPASVLTGLSVDSHYASIDSAGNVVFGVGGTLGSTNGVTNAAGTVTSKLDYEPYGQTTGTTASSYPFAFTGRVPAAGNVFYFRDRYYDTSTARFLSEDPIGFWHNQSNLYRYALGNPLRFWDPDGDQPEDPDGNPLTPLRTPNRPPKDPYEPAQEPKRPKCFL